MAIAVTSPGNGPRVILVKVISSDGPHKILYIIYQITAAIVLINRHNSINIAYIINIRRFYELIIEPQDG